MQNEKETTFKQSWCLKAPAFHLYGHFENYSWGCMWNTVLTNVTTKHVTIHFATRSWVLLPTPRQVGVPWLAVFLTTVLRWLSTCNFVSVCDFAVSIVWGHGGWVGARVYLLRWGSLRRGFLGYRGERSVVAPTRSHGDCVSCWQREHCLL